MMNFPGGPVVENPSANAGTPVQFLVWEDPTGHGATKPVCHNYWAGKPQWKSSPWAPRKTQSSQKWIFFKMVMMMMMTVMVLVMLTEGNSQSEVISLNPKPWCFQCASYFLMFPIPWFRDGPARLTTEPPPHFSEVRRRQGWFAARQSVWESLEGLCSPPVHTDLTYSK